MNISPGFLPTARAEYADTHADYLMALEVFNNEDDATFDLQTNTEDIDAMMLVKTEIQFDDLGRAKRVGDSETKNINLTDNPLIFTEGSGTVNELLSHISAVKQNRRERKKLSARKTRVKKKMEDEDLRRRLRFLKEENLKLFTIIQDSGIEVDFAEYGINPETVPKLGQKSIKIKSSDSDSTNSISSNSKAYPMDILAEEICSIVDLDTDDFSIAKSQPGSRHGSLPGSRCNSLPGSRCGSDAEDDDDQSHGTNGSGQILNCVIVEDSTVQAKVLAHCIMNIGVQTKSAIKIFTCSSGEKAREFLNERGGNHADIWFIDQNLGMGDSDTIQGSDLTKEIRDKPECVNSFVICVTANPLSHFESMTKAGADAVWSKENMSSDKITARFSRLFKMRP